MFIKKKGNTVSLGFYEKDDTITLLENLKKNFGYDEFILWGRSMGASTSVLVASQYPVYIFFYHNFISL
jgi:hypothetical protein